MNNLFSGLEELGFKNINDDLYKENASLACQNKAKLKKATNPEDLLYDKSINCPVCGNNFKSRAVKSGKVRLISKDSDLMPRYQPINPIYYDIHICPRCGYAAMSKFFDKIKEHQANLIKEKISPRFNAKKYPSIYDLDIAIERYKLSLLNSLVKNAKSSEKAYTCLKLGWLYRIKEDTTGENKFIQQACIGFKEAYEKESFPICGMDSYTYMYLLGELSRKIGDNSEAIKWFGRVIVSTNVNPRLKDLARDQKNLIKGIV